MVHQMRCIQLDLAFVFSSERSSNMTSTSRPVTASASQSRDASQATPAAPGPSRAVTGGSFTSCSRTTGVDDWKQWIYQGSSQPSQSHQSTLHQGQRQLPVAGGTENRTQSQPPSKLQNILMWYTYTDVFYKWAFHSHLSFVFIHCSNNDYICILNLTSVTNNANLRPQARAHLRRTASERLKRHFRPKPSLRVTGRFLHQSEKNSDVHRRRPTKRPICNKPAKLHQPARQR